MMKNRLSVVPLYLIAVFLLLSTGIGITGYLYYEGQKNAIKAAAYDDISTVAALKVNEISRWRSDCIRDAETIMNNIMTVPRIRQLLRNPTASGLRRDVGDWMSSLRNSYNYRAVLLLDDRGSVRLSVPSD